MVGLVQDVASFRPNDHPALVEASLSCPVCLSGDVGWRLELADFDDAVHCHCRHCHHRRVMSLGPGQALRLSLESA